MTDEELAAAAGIRLPFTLKINEVNGEETEIMVNSLSNYVGEVEQQLAESIGKDPLQYDLKLLLGVKPLERHMMLRAVAEDLLAHDFKLLVVVEDAKFVKGAMKRLMKEFRELEDGNAGVVNPRWGSGGRILVSIEGKRGTPYADGIFQVEFAFPKDYPFHPPRVHFFTKIWAAHVKPDSGEVRRGISNTSETWSPAKSVGSIIREIYENMEHPNNELILALYRRGENVPNPRASQQLDENRTEFEDQAREWTRLYAGPKMSA